MNKQNHQNQFKRKKDVFRVLTDKHFADNSPSFCQNTLSIYTLQLQV